MIHFQKHAICVLVWAIVLQSTAWMLGVTMGWRIFVVCTVSSTVYGIALSVAGLGEKDKTGA